MKQNEKLLIAEDDDDYRDFLLNLLRGAEYEIIEARDGVDAIARMTEEVRIALIDNQMPRLSGLECLSLLRNKFPNTEVIILSGGGVTNAVAVMKEGAFWYLQKPLNPEELLALLKKAGEHVRLRDQSNELRQAIAEPSLSADAAQSYLISREIEAQLGRIASQDCSVLITGETGTGKSTLARCIHQRSMRKMGPFVAISCAALPRDLFEAELFGYERGAFTGAVKARPGRMEIADEGTLFLDEIGDMALELQPKLLTFLEERIIHRIGSNRAKKINIRVISATLQDLDNMCADSTFREDLYFRLKVICLHIPPLRKRPADIPYLARALLNKIGARYQRPDVAIDENAMAKILEYDWPGNIRELENCLERAIVLCGDSTIRDEFITLGRTTRPTHLSSLAGISLDEIERQAICQTLQLCSGNKKEAARRLGISEKSIYNKMSRLEKRIQ